MRKIALMLALMLMVAPCALAQPLPLAAALDMHAQFQRYPGFAMDAATGNWSAHGLMAQQLLGAVERGEASGYMEGGVCVLYPGVRGSRDLSLMEPVLYVCLLRSAPIKAEALSIATGGVRYDFTGKAEETKIGHRTCERFALPMDEAGLALMRSFEQAGGQIRIYGETRVFKTAISEQDKYKTAKLRVEAMSLGAVRDFLALWPREYALWDLNALNWEKDRPKMEKVALAGGEYDASWPILEPATDLLDVGKGSAIKAYQQLLKDTAFSTATPDALYGKMTRAATKQAQQYYGLLPTGMADRALIGRLKGAPQPQALPQPAAPTAPLVAGAAQPGTAYALDGRLSLRLDRCWQAYALSPSRSQEALGIFAPADRSNRLYVADGQIVNLSGTSAQLSGMVGGYVQMDGIRYPATVQCERDEGRGLGASLLPMGKSRLIVACEVPEGIDPKALSLHLEVQGDAGWIALDFGP